jgi:hypothetical protein
MLEANKGLVRLRVERDMDSMLLERLREEQQCRR